MRFILSSALAVVLLLGCTRAPRQADIAPAEAAVRGAADAWARAFAARDLDGIAAGFADDAVALYPRSRPTIGRAANRRDWAAFYARPTAEHPLTVDTVVLAASGDMAFTRGRYAVRYDGASGPVHLGGQYLAVWRPDAGGVWRVATLAANMYTPLPGVEPRP